MDHPLETKPHSTGENALFMGLEDRCRMSPLTSPEDHGLSQRKLTSGNFDYVVAGGCGPCDRSNHWWIMPLLRKLLLGVEPAGTLSSLDELFALASAMEKEA